MTDRKFYLECLKCGRKVEPGEYLRACPEPECGGLLVYRYAAGRPEVFPDPSFGDSIWRFSPLLATERPSESRLDIPKTPLIKSTVIGPFLGLENLYLKVESGLPTRTFKDREAFMAITRFLELGIRRLVTSTTGDSGAAYLRAALMSGLDLTVFVPENAISRWEQIEEEVVAAVPPPHRGTYQVVIAGRTFDQAIKAAGEYADRHQVPLEYGFANQLRVEGVKTLSLEVIESLGKIPDVYIQAIGSGVGLFSFHKGSMEWKGTVPRLYGVQPGGCNPAVRADQGVTPPEMPVVDTHVVGIANPALPASWSVLKSIGCRFLTGLAGGRLAEREEIPRLLSLYRREGIEDAGMEVVCALSGLEALVARGEVLPDETVVLAVSGGLRPSDIEDM